MATNVRKQGDKTVTIQRRLWYSALRKLLKDLSLNLNKIFLPQSRQAKVITAVDCLREIKLQKREQLNVRP